MRRITVVVLGLILSVALSWILWGGPLRTMPPSPPAPTLIERQFGFNVDPKTAAILDRKLPAPFKTESLGQAIDKIRDASGANIFVNWRALRNDAITPSTAVAADLSGLPLRDAMIRLLSQASTNQAKLAAAVDEEVIIVSTVDDLAKNTQTKVYDVRDLICRGPVSSRIAAGNTLVQQITAAVGPKSWRSAGGQVGSIRLLSGQLIVTQTELNQREIALYLYEVRWRKAVYPVVLRAGIIFSAVLLAVVAEAWFSWRRARREKRMAGLCPICSYDLRATTGRCPECGTPIPTQPAVV